MDPQVLFGRSSPKHVLAEECEPTTKVLVVAPANDVTFFRELLARGEVVRLDGAIRMMP